MIANSAQVGRRKKGAHDVRVLANGQLRQLVHQRLEDVLIGELLATLQVAGDIGRVAPQTRRSAGSFWGGRVHAAPRAGTARDEKVWVKEVRDAGTQI